MLFLENKLQSVPFSKLRHSDLPCYVSEGYGGSSIENWPVYTFFKQYINNEKVFAQNNFEKWYKEQLQKYSEIPKKKGGMYKGSLYRLVEKRSGTIFKNTSEVAIKAAIRERTQQRFSLLENIKKNGYDVNSERIDGVKKKGCVYIHGGHHRAAALLVLGKDELPAVLVFPNQLVYNVFCLLRNIKHGHF